MSLTVEVSIKPTASVIPTGYTIPTLPALPAGQVQSGSFTTDVAVSGVADADDAVGIAQLLAAIDTYVTNTFAPTILGLDSTLNDVDINVTINKVTRAVDGANIYYTGTDEYAVSAVFSYVSVVI